MTDTLQARASERLALTPEYSTPYNAIVRDEIVMGVSRYFIERWLPVLGVSAAALVNTLRQLDYRCQGGVIEISGAALAREAAMSRRHLYTCLDHPWIGAFVQLDPGPRRRAESGQIIQGANRYRVRMDDPLAPADADHLLDVLAAAADTPLEAARRALEMPPRDLWAPDPTGPAPRFTRPRALTALDVLERAFPAHKLAAGDDRAALIQAAEDLHRHLTLVRSDGRAAKIIVPQYFRRRWWPRLGHDLAWAYLWLRGCVYDNPDDGVRRDTCWIPSLNALLAIIGRPREWWRRNVEHAAERPDGWSVADFFRQTDARKGRDPAHPQWVARQFTVALDLPLAPEDRARHADLVRRWPELHPETAAPGSATSAHTGEEGVRHIPTHRPLEGSPHPDTLASGTSATSVHTGEEGVRHIPAQGSATPAHRQDSESENQAPISQPPELTSRKHPDPAPDAASAAAPPAAAAATTDKGNGSGRSLPAELRAEALIDRLSETFERRPETPLYRAAPPDLWLRQAWAEPVRRHTPAWLAVHRGDVSPRDLVALMLAVWADPSVQHPPRYLSWLIQRWQMLPDAPPVEHWPVWQALADLPLGDWFGEGRRQWIELTPAARRALPFGLDVIEAEIADPAPAPEFVPPLPRSDPPGPDGLSEPVGNTRLSMRDIWGLTLGQLRARLDATTYAIWVEGARAIRYADGVLTVRVRGGPVRDWLVRHLNEEIEAEVSSLAGVPVAVRYEVVPPLSLAAVLAEGASRRVGG